MAVIKSSDLDFDTIKNSLKTYLQQSNTFSDYDFEASGLSNILDVLAHNTHINGLIANFAINESFLSTAQLRSSVVSHAETLGYNTRSKTASTANLNLSISTTLTSPGVISLQAYTPFTAVVDGVSYNFLTTEEVIGYNNGSGLYTFRTSTNSTSIPVKEGKLKTKTFIVGDDADEQVYVIPDINADTSTLSVKLFDSISSSTFFTYNDINTQVRVTDTSRVYIIREAPNSYYEMTFSDGNVLGVSPKAGQKIEVQYISCTGANANGASTFTPNGTFNINDVNYNITTTTVTNSSGGSERETIESIKLNAPLAFASQQRLVTSDDYQALIKERYSSTLEDVSAWGGQDNVPPEYGKVYISLNFKDGVLDTVKDTVKGAIDTILSQNLSVMSITTEFEDPVFTFLELGCDFNFDPDLSGNTVQTVEAQAKNLISNYVKNNLNTFNAVFRKSNILSQVDGLTPAILDSKMEVKLQQRFVPTTGLLKTYTLTFPVTLADPDDELLIVTSSRFVYNGVSCSLQNKLNTNIIQVIDEFDNIIVDNIGNYNSANGRVQLIDFKPSSFDGDSIKVSVFPANQDTVKPLRNYILSIDDGLSFARATIDFQNTAVTL